MKGLLHSKLFKKNLLRWLFMYVTVIGLFTTVVTYSKYISSMQNSDVARPAKFDASITYDGVCSGTAEDVRCNIGTFRPTSELVYYFTVDARNLEVTTLFVTRISIKNEFKNIVIYDITDGTKIPTSFENEGNVFTLTRTINVDESYVRKYMVTMDYIHRYGGADHLEVLGFEDVLTVGYSATQVK